MSRYRKIEVRTWSDEKFRRLSPMPPSGQGLWFFLLTGPHTGPIPGLFRAGRAAMAEELGWDLQAFDEAFAEVFAEGMVKADFKAKLVWLPNALKHNRPESPNVVRSWRVELDLLPECDLKHEALAYTRETLAAVGESFAAAFDEAVSRGAERSHGKATPKPSPKPRPNQEQEQEQEQLTPLSNPGGLDAAGAAGDAGEAVTIKPGRPAKPPCPHQEIIALYHEILPMCPQVRDWTPARSAHLRTRWNEDPKRQNLAYWKRLFEYVATCDFLVGRSGKTPFFADLEWIVKSANFTKIREAKYENRGR